MSSARGAGRGRKEEKCILRDAGRNWNVVAVLHDATYSRIVSSTCNVSSMSLPVRLNRTVHRAETVGWIDHLNVARLRAHVVYVRPLEPWNDEMHSLRQYRLLHPRKPAEHDCTVTTLHCQDGTQLQEQKKSALGTLLSRTDGTNGLQKIRGHISEFRRVKHTN